jgi:hypothetical protein
MPTNERIITSHDPKPIPDRRFDWTAVLDGYEPGCPIGYGRTEQAAIMDLMDRLEEQES